MKKSLLALTAITLGASLLGFAAPAHADERLAGQTPPGHDAIGELAVDEGFDGGHDVDGVEAQSDHYRTINSLGASMYSAPRLAADILAPLDRGSRVAVYCGITNSDGAWVKIKKGEGANAPFGYVLAAYVDGHIEGLPTTCPTEEGTYDYVTWSHLTHGDIVPRWTCPPTRPYLVGGKESIFDLVPGLKIVTNGAVTVTVGFPIPIDGPAGKKYVSGYTGGLASGFQPFSAAITATCTNNLGKAAKFE